eukprot:TRINITY_DN29916_c0_g1_i1.p1 TRINITY_DN29916_c0_g1~~TRINITY_DN29916_c0_g1_i1.p1  ORF type:complete len:300 (-),score=25.97 TRINITY_DN29916_c0_g1_i1:54-953(-)
MQRGVQLLRAKGKLVVHKPCAAPITSTLFHPNQQAHFKLPPAITQHLLSGMITDNDSKRSHDATGVELVHPRIDIFCKAVTLAICGMGHMYPTKEEALQQTQNAIENAANLTIPTKDIQQGSPLLSYVLLMSQLLSVDMILRNWNFMPEGWHDEHNPQLINVATRSLGMGHGLALHFHLPTKMYFMTAHSPGNDIGYYTTYDPSKDPKVLIDEETVFDETEAMKVFDMQAALERGEEVEDDWLGSLEWHVAPGGKWAEEKLGDKRLVSDAYLNWKSLSEEDMYILPQHRNGNKFKACEA